MSGTMLDTDIPKRDEDLPGFKYARALTDYARSAAHRYTKAFKSNWRYLLGLDHHAIPITAAAINQDNWQCKGIRNYLFAVHQAKAATILSAPAKVIVEPLDEESTYYQRLLIGSVIEQELERVHWKKVSRDVYNWGAACGVGIAMYRVVPDKLTGDMAIELLPINADEFFIDPSADDPRDPRCRYVVWEPTLDMSEVRQISRTKAHNVSAEYQTVSSETSNYTYNSGNTDENLIYGTAGEFLVDTNSKLQARRAKVCFVWIRDTDTLIEELQETVLQEPTDGLECISCGLMYPATEELEADSPCPTCGGDMEAATIPAKTKHDRVVRRAYPYGRLIVYSGKTLLFDGPNELEIEGVFPFMAYRHYEVPGVFYGYGDVTLLKSSQMIADKTIGQVVDYVRLAANGPIVVPMGEPAWTKLGNAPNQVMPMKPQNCNLVRYMSPQNFNVQAVDLLERMTQRDFQIVSGFSDPVAGIVSQFPMSSEQSQMQGQTFSTRTMAHRRLFDEFQSECASVCWQLMKQFYTDPMRVRVEMPNTELKSVEVAVQQLPQNVNVRVTASLEKTLQDKNLGQNLAGLVSAGLVPPDPDLILPKIIGDSETARQLIERQNIHNELNPGQPRQPVLSAMPPQGGPGA